MLYEWEPMWERVCVFVVLQNERSLRPSRLKPEGCGTSCLPHFVVFLSSIPSTLWSLCPPALCCSLQGAVVSERFLNVLNPSISLCPGKKYIRMKLKRPTGAKMCEKKTSIFPTICGNRKKKRERELLFFNKKIKTNWLLFKEQHKALNKWL